MPPDVGVHHPLLRLVRTRQLVDFADRIVATASRSEAVATALEARFPGRFEGILDPRLQAAVQDGRYSERSEFPIRLRYVHSFGRLRSPRLARHQMIDQVSAVLWRFHHHVIDARRLPALIHLRHTPHTDQRVGVATQHEPLEGADRIPVARLRRPEDALPQIADLPISFAPVDALPVGQPRGSDCSVADVHLSFPAICARRLVLQGAYRVHVSTLSGRALLYPASYGFLVPFGSRPSLFGPSFSS